MCCEQCKCQSITVQYGEDQTARLAANVSRILADVKVTMTTDGRLRAMGA